jgi:hypothetical protein
MPVRKVIKKENTGRVVWSEEDVEYFVASDGHMYTSEAEALRYEAWLQVKRHTVRCSIPTWLEFRKLVTQADVDEFMAYYDKQVRARVVKFYGDTLQPGTWVAVDYAPGEDGPDVYSVYPATYIRQQALKLVDELAQLCPASSSTC